MATVISNILFKHHQNTIIGNFRSVLRGCIKWTIIFAIVITFWPWGDPSYWLLLFFVVPVVFTTFRAAIDLGEAQKARDLTNP